MALPATVQAPADEGREDRRKSRRRDLRHARSQARAVTSLKRVRLCGWASRGEEGVSVRVTVCEGVRRAGYAGVQTCGSFWACPVCSEKVAAARQSQIESVLRWWTRGDGVTVASGRRVALATFTVRHKPWHRLRTVWDVVGDAWHAVTSGGTWKAEQARFGSLMTRTVKRGKKAGQVVADWRIPTIRVVEVTHGRSGWHVHVHCLLLLPAGTTDADVVQLGRGMWRRWAAAATREGMTPEECVGFDIRRLKGDPAAALGDYFVKAAWSGAHEVTGGMRKQARNGNRTPFAILRDVVEPPAGAPLSQADDDLALWQEWEKASKGRRAIAFSPGLLDAAAVADFTDEEAADEDAGGETVAPVPDLVWRRLRGTSGECDVLEAFEVSDEAGRALLGAWYRAVTEGLSAPHRF